MKLTNENQAKLSAAMSAVDYIEDGMTVGLGSGSTSAWMVEYLAKRIAKENLSIKGVPTSIATKKLAETRGISLTTLDQVDALDLTIDGTDECDKNYNLIKGGGAALLYEKIVAKASKKVIIIADVSKYVNNLGSFPLPVEVIEFGWRFSKTQIELKLWQLGYCNFKIELRMNDKSALKTDEGNLILDVKLFEIKNPAKLTQELNSIPGVVENGLFVDICNILILGNANGDVEVCDVLNKKITKKQVNINKFHEAPTK